MNTLYTQRLEETQAQNLKQQHKNKYEKTTETDREINSASFCKINNEEPDKNETLLKLKVKEVNITRAALNIGLDWIHLTDGGK